MAGRACVDDRDRVRLARPSSVTAAGDTYVRTHAYVHIDHTVASISAARVPPRPTRAQRSNANARTRQPSPSAPCTHFWPIRAPSPSDVARGPRARTSTPPHVRARPRPDRAVQPQGQPLGRACLRSVRLAFPGCEVGPGCQGCPTGRGQQAGGPRRCGCRLVGRHRWGRFPSHQNTFPSLPLSSASLSLLISLFFGLPREVCHPRFALFFSSLTLSLSRWLFLGKKMYFYTGFTLIG